MRIGLGSLVLQCIDSMQDSIKVQKNQQNAQEVHDRQHKKPVIQPHFSAE